MTWATDRRLDYIDWRLALHGSVRRQHLMETFGVSQAQASGDLAAFERMHPGAMRYDKSAKQYVPAGTRYRSQRRMDESNIRRAISILAAEGHPMGWSG